MESLTVDQDSLAMGSPTSSVVSTQDRSANKWLGLLFIAMSAWVALPWLAPILMQVGWASLAKPIYWLYSFQCHQLPQRSFFLFGPQPMLSLSQVQAAWQNTTNPAILREFIGNEQLGYKVAWSDRMVSAYSSVLLGGLVWFLLRKRVRFFPWRGMLILALPMALDGITHMMSDFAGIGEGFRYTNEWLAKLTEYRLPPSFYAGSTFGTFNSWMRLNTGVLFGVGVGWFAFSNLGTALSDPKRVRAPGEVVSQSKL